MVPYGCNALHINACEAMQIVNAFHLLTTEFTFAEELEGLLKGSLNLGLSYGTSLGINDWH